MRVAVIGLGSSGRRHRGNLRSLGCETVAVRRTPDAGDLGSLEEAAAWQPDAVVIATPTSTHLDLLSWAVARGVHAYVEKPLAASPAGVAEVLASAEAAGLVVAVGYNLRWHPALEAIRAAVSQGRIGRLLSVRAEVGHHLPDWHPGEDYRVSYAARREFGGGALLTLSHELDFVRWIAGEIESRQIVVAKVSALEIDVDDVTEVVCRHASGALSSVHMDLFDRSYNRRSRWIGESATLEWRWGGPVTMEPGGEELWQDDRFDIDQSYVAAMRDFLACVATGAQPRCSGQDGLRVLEVCAGAGGL